MKLIAVVLAVALTGCAELDNRTPEERQATAELLRQVQVQTQPPAQQPSPACYERGGHIVC